ncbi:MAG: bifunctional metallophosphatase/5'-nucleotidase [Deltaproteobacteria bacterium]|nr:bifunctional metallophosphatase/5'-nucleotidase [Deltaproteobacteria bacterium]
MKTATRIATSTWLVVLLTLSGCLKQTKVDPVENYDVKITFIHTADWHSRLLPYSLHVSITDQSLGLKTRSDGPTNVGGAARAATVIRRIRAKGGRIVHLDSGDVFQGAPIFNEFDGEVELKVLSMIGVDAMAIGNHEFDLGIRNLVKLAQEYARFPLLAANYDTTNPNVPGASELGKIAKPYVILNKDGVKIGVIGLGCLSSIVSLYYGGNSLGATPLETVKQTQFWIDFLRPQVDVIAVVSHLGLRGEKKMSRGDETDLEMDCPNGNCGNDASSCSIIQKLIGDEQLIQYTTGIDVVFGGHLHIVLNPPEALQDCSPDPSCLSSEHGAAIIAHLAKLGCYCYPKGDPRYDPDCKPHHRRVPLVHSGAFVKFVGELDTVFNKPDRPADPDGTDCNANPEDGRCRQHDRDVNQWKANGFELSSYQYILHPVDERIPESEFDGRIQALLQHYTYQLKRKLHLGRIIAFAPRKIRRYPMGQGDSALGDVVAAAMQTRNRVEAQFGLTNTLGIRADIESGPVTVDVMYNVFPFENKLTTMTLSGSEVLELMDYVALRSARRGCQAQAQVSGITAVLNCKDPQDSPYGERAERVTIGGSRLSDPATYGKGVDGPLCQFDGLQACTPASTQVCMDLARCSGEVSGACPDPPPAQPDPPCCDWRLAPVNPCPADYTPGDGACCPSGELCTPVGCGTPVEKYVSYKLAANDYIANGGSGFTTLEHNTTQFNTGISLRDAVTDYIFTQYPACGWDPTNYSLCVDSLTNMYKADCAYEKDARKDACEAQAPGRAEALCQQLPCIVAKEDGRLGRVFPTK